uniref:Deoxynucleoside kinase domain-containing protein n=1 Tax=viral metagenome TaxID=1070528 RepID=A0A6C0HMA0_9ZZZZ
MSLDLDIVTKSEKFQKVLDIIKNGKKKFYIFDGIIGAGKTTFITMLETSLKKTGIKAKAILEPVDIWNDTGALKYFYSDIEQNCYEFQTFTYITRIDSVINTIFDNQDIDIYLLERSIWTDRYIFMELLKPKVGNLRMQMYNMWCDLWVYIMPIIADKWILLNTSLNESISRIKMRNRNGENNINIEYQTELYKKHIEFYIKLQKDGKNVIIIENALMDDNFVNNDSIFNKIVEQIFNQNI